MPADEALSALDSETDGLTPSEAEDRLAEHGPNALAETEGETVAEIALKQLKQPLIYLLIGAAVVSLLADKPVDAIVIGIVVLLNSIIGVVQEYRAERALEALRSLAAPVAYVIRDGERLEIDASDLVPGDILAVEAGDVVSADARIIRATRLEVDESALTGESETVPKQISPVEEDTPVADRDNMLFKSTHVTGGRGRAVVVATGMDTEIGEIAGEVRATEREATPLQRRLQALSFRIGMFALGMAGLVLLVGLLRGLETVEMVLYSVAVAVSAIPEGLPAVISIVLALGVRRMSERNAIVRQLPAVETLGSTTVICSDKTGTITRNEMTVTRLWAGCCFYSVTGIGYEPDGELEIDDGEWTEGLEMLLRIGVLSNDSDLTQDEEGRWTVDGDPSEGALLAVAMKAGLDPQELRSGSTCIHEIPFSSEYKYMATVHELSDRDERLVLAKGAPERILNFCSHAMEDGERREIDDEMRQRIDEASDELARDGLRVMAGAWRQVDEEEDEVEREDVESGLTLAGFWGIVDPPREAAVKAIEQAQRAGIRVVMITGDHAATAASIAEEVGIETDRPPLTGAELEELDEEEFDREVCRTAVFARVTPTHKRRIADALGEIGEVVAVTGDGVNDAPALKGADIGVAMGQTGTEVAREAADIVLTDDNFATIVAAVEEGRVIFANLRRVVFYLLATNVGEIITLLAAILIGLPLPLTAVMVIWINLVTDGICDVTVGVEPIHSDVLERPPRSKDQGVIDRTMIVRIAYLAPIMAVGTLAVFWTELDRGHQYAQTMAFTTLAAFQWFQALNARSENQSILAIGLFTNRWLVLGIAAVAGLQVAAIHTAIGQEALGVVALSVGDWARALLTASSIFIIEELRKRIVTISSDYRSARGTGCPVNTSASPSDRR
ncbi:MAG: cation-translocating P-type ATPase [Armatimonadota bacterium]